MVNSIPIQKACIHCGDVCYTPIVQNNQTFCCNGCAAVFSILQDHDLAEFYSFEKNPGTKPRPGNPTQFDFLDADEISSQLLDFAEGNHKRVTLELPQIHCSSCVWLLENLPKLDRGILSSEVNFGKRQARIAFNSDKISLRDIAELLTKIGYEPNFFRSSKNNNTSTSRSNMMRLAVAGFCFGNIMLFTFPEYLISATNQLNQFRPFFSWLTALLALPILLYSSRPFLNSALKGIKTLTANLDIPISIGIVTLYARSMYDIIVGNGSGYMDSFAGFVFLLLIGRWFQSKTYESLAFDRDHRSYLPLAVYRYTNDKQKVITPISQLKSGEHIHLRDGEIIPADGELLSSRAQIDYSFVSGEDRLIEKMVSDQLFAGGRIRGFAIDVKLSKAADQSYLADLWQKDQVSENASHLTKRVNRLSKYFLVALLSVVAVVSVIWFFIDASRVPEIATAVLIVACPCALALSISFIYGYMQRNFGHMQMYLKQSAILENLSQIDTIVFDKTGTLSSPSALTIEWRGNELSLDSQAAVKALCANSNQPLALKIFDSLIDKPEGQLTSFKTIEGSGMEGEVNDIHYRIGSPSFLGIAEMDASSVGVEVAGQYLGSYVFHHAYRDVLPMVVNNLKGKDLHMLSGDNDADRTLLSAFFEDENMHFRQDPMAKKRYVKKLQAMGRKVLMLGDGLNDIGALAQADVGIALAEDLHQFTPACDGILPATALAQLPSFISMAKKSVHLLKGALVFSLLYNLLGLGFAAAGVLTPLVAAILMPLSSVSVVLYAWLGTKWIAYQPHNRN